MRSITQRIVICFFTGVVLAGTPERDTLAAEPETSHATVDAAPDEPATATPEQEGSGSPPDAGEVHERGFGPARLPQSSLPNPALINAGTPSLTTIANAIRVTHRSVSIHVDVPGVLSLPVPVEVTAKFVVYGYSSPELKGITGPGGVHLVHHMPDKKMIPGGGSGPLAHKVTVYLTLRETDQTARSFSFPVRELIITPLYDITVLNMTFRLVKACDSWIRGKSDIALYWSTPARTGGHKKFKLNGGETLRVPEFDWSAKEAQQVNLFEPRFLFRESDNVLPKYDPPRTVHDQATQLLQAVAGRHRVDVEQKDAGGAGCTARIGYTIQRKLLTF